MVEQFWKQLLHRKLKGKSEPVFVFPEAAVSSAALWMGIRLWMQRWTEGPVVYSALSHGPEYLETLGGCLARNGTFIAGHPERGEQEIAEEVIRWQPDFVVVDRPMELPGYRQEEPINENRQCLLYSRCRGYEDLADQHPLRKSFPQQERRLILSTSGTSGVSRWAVLSDENVFSVLRSHLPLLGMRKANVLSVLPWNHAFGLILDLLPSLFHARSVVRFRGLDEKSFLSLSRKFSINYLSSVPVVFDRLVQSKQCLELLSNFQGGLLGGAPVESTLASRLQGSRFRIGYGQTEASPGITLGEAGEFRTGHIGTARGCEIKLQDGTLRYRGRNVCSGVVRFEPEELRRPTGAVELRSWIVGRMEVLASCMETREAFSWQDTGDIVEEDERGYLFLGRRDQNFKLPNGTFLDVVRWEQKLNAIPGIRRSIILPASGGLNVYLVCESGYDAVSLIQKSRLCMSRIDHYLRDVAELNEEDLPRNPKGIILR
ncbi:MAG: acyl--CoA ligase, partial [Leptospiraceae bacterium]|nr:acyl--CoA ligase [Leptospiraceae bacterium]